jgi:predicted porin
MQLKTIVARPSLARLSSLAVASALCCAGVAQAQEKSSGSSVTLYGIVDAGVTTTSGIKGGSPKQLASGIMEGSRWGLKGNEDIGGGFRAIFTLESRLELDTGSNSNRPISGSQLPDRFSKASLLGLPAPLQPAVTAVNTLIASEYGVNVGQYGNRLFDRQAYAGLITPVGAVLGGRMYTPAFETSFQYDIMATESALSPGQLLSFPAGLEIRSSNSIAYRIEKDGLKSSVMVSQGNGGEDAGNGSRLMGLNASYTFGGLSAGFGYNTQKNELGKNALATTVLGASAKMNQHMLAAMYVKVKDENPAGLSRIAASLTPSIGASLANLVQTRFTEAFKQDGALMHFGYRFVTGANTITVAYNTYDDKRPNNADVKSYGAAYSYALSKRTDINVVGVKYVNEGLAQVAPGGNGYIGGVTSFAGEDSNALALGVRHRF